MRLRRARRLRDHDWVAALLDLLIVVIGILIALQVSNWNQARRDVRREHAYLERILTDLQTDLRVNGNRERFMAQVGRYGEQALAHADTGALVDSSAWKTVIAYYQPGQFHACSRESNAFAEMRDVPQLVRELRFWLSSQRVAALNAPEDRRDALQLKALLERELGH